MRGEGLAGRGRARRATLPREQTLEHPGQRIGLGILGSAWPLQVRISSTELADPVSFGTCFGFSGSATHRPSTTSLYS